MWHLLLLVSFFCLSNESLMGSTRGYVGNAITSTSRGGLFPQEREVGGGILCCKCLNTLPVVYVLFGLLVCVSKLTFGGEGAKTVRILYLSPKPFCPGTVGVVSIKRRPRSVAFLHR